MFLFSEVLIFNFAASKGIDSQDCTESSKSIAPQAAAYVVIYDCGVSQVQLRLKGGELIEACNVMKLIERPIRPICLPTCHEQGIYEDYEQVEQP